MGKTQVEITSSVSLLHAPCDLQWNIGFCCKVKELHNNRKY